MPSASPLLIPSVPDEDIDAELAAGLSPEEAAELQVARLRLAALEDEAGRSTVPADAERSRRRQGDPRDLIEAAARVRPVALAREQLLPVLDELAPLLPDAGLRRGSTVAVGSGSAGSVGGGSVASMGSAGVGPMGSVGVGSAGRGPVGSVGSVGPVRAGGAAGMEDRVVGGATALALALAAAASAEGSWTALVGLPTVGLVAAAELGLALERLAVIATPPPEQWATVVAALVGAFDLVLVPVPPATRAAEVRRLVARSRERGSVLVQLSPLLSSPVGGARASGDDLTLGADVRLTVTSSRWHGLRGGAGHLQARRLTIETSGRRRAARPHRTDLWLPGPSGAIELAEPRAVADLPRARDREPVALVVEQAG